MLDLLDPVEIGILAKLVIARAKVDKTVPDPKNLRKGWRTDELLTGDVDLLVVGGDNPGAYVLISEKVLEKVQDLPEMAVLAKLAILRGKRLLPLTPVQKNVIFGFSDLRSAISASLPDGTRKQRCLELFLYHLGIFYDALGDFAKAIKMHEWAAQEAGDESSSAAISLFCAALYRLKSALVVGKTPDELGALFSDLEEKFAQLAEALRGSELEVQWAEGNGPMHMIQACVWLNLRNHPRWDDWVRIALAATEKLGKAWEPGAEFVRAVDMEKRDDPQAVEALEATAANNGNSNEVKATALLLLARHALRDRDVDAARNLIGQMPEQGAQHVRAIAERMYEDYLISRS